jgi:cytochrome c-type biogenesis protein CcmH
VAAQIGAATDTVLEARVRAVASELRCPVCQGESIQDSPAALAQEMRGIVREQLAAGRSPDEVKAYFVDKYGEWILLRPKAQGWNMLVYLLPLVVLLVGGAVVARATRRWTTPASTKRQDELEPETAET